MTIRSILLITLVLFAAYSIYFYRQHLQSQPIPASAWDYQMIPDQVHYKEFHIYSLAAYNHFLDRTAELAMSCDICPKQPTITLPMVLQPMTQYIFDGKPLSQPVTASLNQDINHIYSIHDPMFYKHIRKALNVRGLYSNLI